MRYEVLSRVRKGTAGGSGVLEPKPGENGIHMEEGYSGKGISVTGRGGNQ